MFRDKGTILELAFGLVVFTVIGVGYFVNWLIPAMPLAVSFALAAIISPTDPIAVSAIAARVPIPRRLMHILEGEALLNDASGLVCMRFAVAAVLTGSFSVTTAFGTFLWLLSGGIAIGVGITWAATVAKNWVSRYFGEETGSQILISLLIPFGAYLLAEQVHCSGILAAVAAGITMSYVEQSDRPCQSPASVAAPCGTWCSSPPTASSSFCLASSFRNSSTAQPGWSARPDITSHSGSLSMLWPSLWHWPCCAFIWVWTSLRFTLFRAHLNGEKPKVPSWRLLAAASFAGVRGAITLAGVLTLPLTMNDGSAFPARDLAIFLAGGVIIVSLIAASITLPFL